MQSLFHIYRAGEDLLPSAHLVSRTFVGPQHRNTYRCVGYLHRKKVGVFKKGGWGSSVGVWVIWLLAGDSLGIPNLTPPRCLLHPWML